MTGGSGGAGATTFACALGQVAARRGRAVVVDADPLGPGVDRVLGLEDRDGVRWDALCDATGRLSARVAARGPAPPRGSRRAHLGAGAARLGCRPSRCARCSRPPGAATTWSSSTCRARPSRWSTRSSPGATGCWSSWCRRSPGVTSAVRTCARHHDPTRVRLVLRGSGVESADVARATGVPVLARMADQRGLAEAIDLGLGPVRSRRGALGRAAGEVLDQLMMMRAVAA